MTLPIKISRRLNLQLGSLDIPSKITPPLQLQEILYLDRPRYPAHDIGLLTIDITLDNAPGSNHNLCITMNISHQISIDPDIPVAGNIPFHGGPRPDQAGAAPRRRFAQDVRLGFSVEHSIRFL
jgi:hypothetical protein